MSGLDHRLADSSSVFRFHGAPNTWTGLGAGGLAGSLHSVQVHLDAVAASKLSEALFANAAILVEGTTDKAVLEGLAEKSSVTSLLSRGITVADVGGKSNIMLAHAILTELGVPCYTMFDGDRDGGDIMRARGKAADKIAEKVAKDIADNRKLLTYLEADVEDFPDTVAHARYAVLEDTLEPLLNSQWTGWDDEARAVVAEGLATGKKNALVYFITARRMTTPPPRFLLDVLRHAQNLTI